MFYVPAPNLCKTPSFQNMTQESPESTPRRPTHPGLGRHGTLGGVSVTHTAAADGELVQRVEVGAEHLRLGPTARERQTVRVERQHGLQSDTDVARSDELQQLGRRPLRGGPACDERHVYLTAGEREGGRKSETLSTSREGIVTCKSR